MWHLQNRPEKFKLGLTPCSMAALLSEHVQSQLKRNKDSADLGCYFTCIGIGGIID